MCEPVFRGQHLLDVLPSQGERMYLVLMWQKKVLTLKGECVEREFALASGDTGEHALRQSRGEMIISLWDHGLNSRFVKSSIGSRQHE